MIAWWKRLIFALLATVIATTAYWTLVFGRELMRRPLDRSSIGAAIFDFLFTEALTLVICLVGCLLASPILFMVSDFRGWRFGMYWAIGTCIGPLTSYLDGVYVYLTQPIPDQFRTLRYPLAGIAIPTVIASLTTLIYLLLVRRAETHKRAATGKTAAA